MKSFDYRAYLGKHGFSADPLADGNLLAREWREFRRQRDDAAWKTLADQIRQYARRQGRTVYLSGNGIARYVDLQVPGVWALWRLKSAGWISRNLKWRTGGRSSNAGRPSPDAKCRWCCSTTGVLAAFPGCRCHPPIGNFGCACAARRSTRRQASSRSLFWDPTADATRDATAICARWRGWGRTVGIMEPHDTGPHMQEPGWRDRLIVVHAAGGTVNGLHPHGCEGRGQAVRIGGLVRQTAFYAAHRNLSQGTRRSRGFCEGRRR